MSSSTAWPEAAAPVPAQGGPDDELEAVFGFLNAAPVGLVQTDLAGQVQLMNGLAARLLLLLSPSARLDNLFQVLQPVAPGLATLVAATGGGTASICEGQRLLLPGARPVHVALSIKRGGPATLIAVLDDITLQVQQEEALREAEARAVAARLETARLEAENRQIQEASRMKSEFLANMSHELRTPLNAIIGFSDLLQTGAVPPDSPQHRQFMGHVASSARHLLQLINDVLDLSKVEAGRLDFFPEAVQLPVLVREVLDVLQAWAQRKRIQVRQDIDPAIGELRLDGSRLKQVLYNFLSNALKFTPAGGCVTVRARPEGDARFRIEVEDTGIGIAEADQRRLFVDFMQIDGGMNKQHEGTGLGLALTRRLIEAQGGSVGVRSTPGVGTVFHAVLDRLHGRRSEVVTLGATGGRRMLVVEDRMDDHDRLLQGLTGLGWQVDEALSGDHALRQARGQAYDALTLDLMLPDQAGLDALGQIRRHGPSRAAPVLGLSLPVQAGQAVRFAIANVLAKPLQVDELRQALSGLAAAPQGARRVVVLDDDPMALDLMRATLQAMGLEPVCLLDGNEALAELQRQPPAALVLDLMMPGLDGFQVLDALGRLPVCAGLPVYLWTAMLLTGEEYATLARSARAIVAKGGGGLAAMLEGLGRGTTAVPALAAANATPAAPG